LKTLEVTESNKNFLHKAFPKGKVKKDLSLFFKHNRLSAIDINQSSVELMQYFESLNRDLKESLIVFSQQRNRNQNSITKTPNNIKLPIPVFEDEFEQFNTQDDLSQHMPIAAVESQPEDPALTSQQNLSARPFTGAQIPGFKNPQ